MAGVLVFPDAGGARETFGQMGDRLAWAVADDPSSPHLSADRITAAVYVAGAIEDGSFTAEQAGLLDRALTGAGVEHTVEFYPLAMASRCPTTRPMTLRRRPGTGRRSAGCTATISEAERGRDRCCWSRRRREWRRDRGGWVGLTRAGVTSVQISVS